MNKTKDLRVKEKKFAQALVKNNGNKTEAMLEVDPTLKRATASTQGYRYSKRKSVQQEVEKALETHNINPEWWASKHKEIVSSLDETKLKRASVGDVQKSLEALGKLMGVSSGGVVSNSHNYLIDLSNSTVSEVLEKRKEYQEWFGEILEGEEVQ